MIANSSSTVSTTRLLAAFILGCMFFAYGFVHRVAPSVMTGELMRDFSVGGSALGSLSAMYFYAYVALQIPVGLLMDRYGPRKLMTAALFVCAIASLAMASSGALWTASLSRFVIGGSVAFAFVGTLTILTRWFVPARFSLFAGLLQSSGMLGAMLGQAPLRVAVEHYNWRIALVGMGLMALVLAVAAFVIVPARKKSEVTAPVTARHAAQNGFTAIIKRPGNWLCVLAGFGLAAPMLGFAALWAVPWLSTVKGLDQTQSAAIASMVFLGWLVVAPFAGWLSDRLGKRKPVLIVGSVFSLLLFIIIIKSSTDSVWLLSTLFFLQGAGGCSMVVCFSVMREYNPRGNTSAAFGSLNTFVVGSGAVMQPMIGFALDKYWQGAEQNGARVYSAANYDQAFGLLIAAGVMAVVCCCMLKESAAVRN